MIVTMSTSNTHSDDNQKLLTLIKDIRVAMMTTFTADGGLHTRPMWTQNPDDAEPGTLWFMTQLDSAKVQELEARPVIHVTYSDLGSNNYVSVRGAGDVVRDPERIKEMWNIHAKAWFPNGPDDPNLGLIRVRTEHAEYWDGPSKPAYALSLLKAVVTGERPYGGEHRVVR